MFEYPTYLIHYGTLGQKWGVRKYQNEDGTWTEEGLRRRRKLYDSDSNKLTKSGEKYYKKLQKEKDKTQKLYSSNSRRLISLQNSYAFETEEQRQYNDRLFKQVFNETVKNIEYSKVIDNELSAIGQKYLVKAKGLDKSIDDVYVKVNENGDKSINFKKNEENETNKNILSNKEVDELQSDIDWAKENYEFRKEILDEAYPKLEKAIKDADILESSSKIWWLEEDKASDFFKSNKRIDDATNLAMKAVGNDWIKENVRQHDKPTKLAFLQESMNYPDDSRASGLVQIADMVNRGYTKDQIMNAIRVSSMISFNYDNRPDGSKIPNKDSLNDISMYSAESREKFIDKCLELSDAKQSRIKSLIASGKSQEEVAKMLGVSTSTVNKYK